MSKKIGDPVLCKKPALTAVLTCVLSLLLLTAFTVTPSFATDRGTYHLEDVGIKIDILPGYYTYTRQFSPDDPLLAELCIDATYFLDSLIQNGIYLDSFDAELNYELVINMSDSYMDDFSLYSDTALIAIKSLIAAAFNDAGAQIDDFDIYHHSQTNFIKLYYYIPDSYQTHYAIRYITVANGKMITVTLHSYAGRISDFQEASLGHILTSLRFDEPPAAPEPSVKSDPFTYDDSKTGAKLAVPANWSQTEQSSDHVNVRFCSNIYPELSIVYSSEDIWKTLPSTQRMFRSRSELNSSGFTYDDFAEYFGDEALDENSFTTVHYGPYEYIKYSRVASQSFSGIDIQMPVTTLIRVQDGYGYMFMFSGNESDPFFKDFEDLVSNVEYPDVSSSRGSDILGIASSLLFSFVLTVLIYSAPILIYRFAIRKKPMKKSRAKAVTVIYGIFAFFIMSLLIIYFGNGAKSGASGGAIITWSLVNYFVLTHGPNNADYTPTEPYSSSFYNVHPTSEQSSENGDSGDLNT